MDKIVSIDIDQHDWETNKHLIFINGKLMDARTAGGNVIGPSFRFAHNVRDTGMSYCDLCHEFYAGCYSNRVSGNHARSRMHQDALNGKFKLKKKQRRNF